VSDRPPALQVQASAAAPRGESTDHFAQRMAIGPGSYPEGDAGLMASSLDV
jgi:hypothetical protein